MIENYQTYNDQAPSSSKEEKVYMATYITNNKFSNN